MANSHVFIPASEKARPLVQVLPGNPSRWVISLLAVVVIGNVAGLFGVGVHTDESYYWIWSRYLDWGYYDHPPLVAWMIRLTTEIFGINKFGLRLPAVLSWLVTAVVVYRISSQLFADTRLAGWLATLVLISIPIFQVGFHIVGPDSPLMLFTSLTYFFAFNAIGKASGKDWLLAGISLGFALLGKYTAVLLPAIIFLGLVSTRESRRELLRWQPWAGFVLAVVCFTPVIYWNSLHDWVSFAYQWGHGTGTAKSFSIYKSLDYISQQVSAVMPWTWLAMIYASFRFPALTIPEKHRTLSLIQFGFWFPLIFFGFAGSFSTSMHNWPVIAYVPGSIMLGGLLAHWLKQDREHIRKARIARSAIIVAVLFAALLVDLARFPQWARLLENPKRLSGSSIVAVWGWDGLADTIRHVEKKHNYPESCQILFIKDYNNAWLGYFHVAGEMAYEFRDPDRILLEPVRHQKQYNYWKNTRLDNLDDVCMVIAGPANQPDFPAELTRKKLGRLKLDARHTITLPDTTSSYYAIYTKENPNN
ncbi:MAG: glycosyltransferase family 39 protein [Acidiferrobacterales bacterium]